MVEVSRNVVAILLLVVIVVSGFGTYTFLSAERADEATGVPVQTVAPGDGSANLALQIQNRQSDATVVLAVGGQQ